MEKTSIGQYRQRKRGPVYKIGVERAAELEGDYLANKLTMEQIADKFEVTKQTIYNTLRRIRKSREEGGLR